MRPPTSVPRAVPARILFCGLASYIAMATLAGVSTARPAGAGVAADSALNPNLSIKPVRLLVTSSPAGAAVYADSVFLGTTPLDTLLPRVDAHRPRTLRLKIVGGEPGAWFVPVLFDSIAPAMTGGPDSVVRHYALPLTARVSSDPAGADVLLGDSLIGTTPLFAAVPGSAALLTLRKEGYRSTDVMLEPTTRNYRVQLLPADPSGAPKSVYLADASGESMFPVFLAAGAAVVSGAAAAYFKEQADREYALYRITGDAATLDVMRRDDIIAGIALIVTEISIGYLVIELLSR